MNKLKVKESDEQIAVMEWARWAETQYKELKLLHHIPNGGKRDPRVAIKLKREGVKPGVPDLHLPIARGGYNSLYIELKANGGKATSKQMEWIEMLNNAGNLAVVCDGAENAINEIKNYLKKG